ncbi:hypothetical protein TNCV_731301 [Trichonephila clavipes]|nr:hypothetical protein TNCV_731301 [Trichonephila clavipes]
MHSHFLGTAMQSTVRGECFNKRPFEAGVRGINVILSCREGFKKRHRFCVPISYDRKPSTLCGCAYEELPLIGVWRNTVARSNGDRGTKPRARHACNLSEKTE